MKIDIKVLELSHDDIVTIISGADGGINYWCQSMGLGKDLKGNSIYSKYKQENDCIEDVQARAILDNNPMIFIDAEDENEKWLMHYDDLLKGVQLWIEKGSCYNINEVFEGQEDAEDYDAIIQYALFGKIVFG